MDLRRLIGELVHHERQEVAEHDVHDGAQSGHRGADAEAGESRLRDRRVDDPLRSEFLHQPCEHFERGAGLGHVLAEQHDAIVPPHLLRDRFLDRFAKR